MVDLIARGLSKTNAIKYGTIGIDTVQSIPDTSIIRFNLVNGMFFDWDLSSTDTMFRSTYDTNNNGIVDKSEKLKNSTDSTFNDGNYYLDRTNHTGFDTANKITVNKTNLIENLATFTGTTLQDLIDFIDSLDTFKNGELNLGTKNAVNSWKIIKEDDDLSFYRYDEYNSQYNLITSFGASVKSDKFILTEWQGSIQGLKGDGTSRTLLKTSVDDNGVLIGNYYGRAGLISNGLYFSMYPTGVDSTFVLNSCTDSEGTSNAQSITKFTTRYQPLVHGFYTGISGLDLISVPSGTTVRVWVESDDQDDIMFETINYINFKKGLGLSVSIGVNNIVFYEPFPIDKDTPFYLNIEFSNAVTIKGSITNNNQVGDPKFYPMGSIIRETAAFEKLATQDWVTENTKKTDSMTTDSSILYASAKSVSSLSKVVSAISGGASPLVPISCEDFSLLQTGTNGQHYIFTNDGIINTQIISKRDHCYVVETFDYTEILPTQYIQEEDYVVISNEVVSNGAIFITNITPNTLGKNVSKTMNDYPNEATINSIASDDDTWTVTVIWDRGSEEYCGQPKVNGIDVINITNVGGGTFTGTVIVTTSEITDNAITATFGTASYRVGVVVETPPIITTLTLNNTPTDYPISSWSVQQTEVKVGDIMTFDIISDKDIVAVEVASYGAGSSKIINVTQGATFTDLTFTVASTGLVSSSKTIKVRVKSPTGSWSDYVESSNSIICNDLTPTISVNTITYPSTQTALKNSETASVTFNTSNQTSVIVTAIGSDISISGVNSTTGAFTATRIGGSYVDNIDNFTGVARKDSNGSSVSVNGCIFIANIAPVLSSQSLLTYNVMSGVGTVTNTLTFSQKVKIKSISALTAGTLVTGTTSTYTTTYGLGISAQSSDTHSNTANTTNLVVTGLSGIDSVSIPINYYIRGFANIVLNFTYSELSKVIGTMVTDVTKCVVSGKILSTPIFEIAKEYITYSSVVLATADKWSISADGLNFLIPDAVKSFGYTTGVDCEINISEIY